MPQTEVPTLFTLLYTGIMTLIWLYANVFINSNNKILFNFTSSQHPSESLPPPKGTNLIYLIYPFYFTFNMFIYLWVTHKKVFFLMLMSV